MALYETTFFSHQKSQSQALSDLRNKINEELSRLKQINGFAGEEAVYSDTAKNAIRNACGNPHTKNDHVYETAIGGQWRIFFAQGESDGVVVLCAGHLQGNVLQLP